MGRLNDLADRLSLPLFVAACLGTVVAPISFVCWAVVRVLGC